MCHHTADMAQCTVCCCMQIMVGALVSSLHRLLKSSEKAVNLRAVAEVLEATICTVPPSFLEQLILSDADSVESRTWKGRMTADLVSPKVAALFRELHMHKEQATEALKQVRQPLKNYLCSSPSCATCACISDATQVAVAIVSPA
jgi:hypothetical protein